MAGNHEIDEREILVIIETGSTSPRSDFRWEPLRLNILLKGDSSNMPVTTVPLNNNPADHRWLVRFGFRIKSHAQANAVNSLGELSWDVVRLWFNVLLPDAHVFQPTGTPIETISFRTRLAARRFIRTWGGRMVATSSPTRHDVNANGDNH